MLYVAMKPSKPRKEDHPLNPVIVAIALIMFIALCTSGLWLAAALNNLYTTAAIKLEGAPSP